MTTDAFTIVASSLRSLTVCITVDRDVPCILLLLIEYYLSTLCVLLMEFLKASPVCCTTDLR
jgi:hypothetical protein